MYFKQVYFDQFLAYPCQILWVQFLQEVVLYPGFYALRTNHGKHQRLPTNAMVSFVARRAGFRSMLLKFIEQLHGLASTDFSMLAPGEVMAR